MVVYAILFPSPISGAFAPSMAFARLEKLGSAGFLDPHSWFLVCSLLK